MGVAVMISWCGPPAAALALLAQGQALVHTKAMLLIHHGQGQIPEAHLFLEQGMGPDHHGQLPMGHRLEGPSPVGSGLFARQPAHTDTQGFEPFAEIMQMLFGQYLGGRHDRHLAAGFHRPQGGQHGDHGLARTHIPLHQAQHGRLTVQVRQHFFTDALLSRRQSKIQLFQEALNQRAVTVQGAGMIFAKASPGQAQADAVSQQFFKGQTSAGRVVALCQGLDRHRGGRPVQTVQRPKQIQAQYLGQHIPGQVIHQQRRFGLDTVQGLGDQVPQAILLQTLGGRIDGRQGLFHRHVLADSPILRVHHFQTAPTTPGFAETTQADITLEVFYLGTGEMEETQRDGPAAIGQGDEQAAATTEDGLGMLDATLHHDAIPGAQAAHGHDPGAIFPTHGQMEEQILNAGYAEAFQALGKTRAHALQIVDTAAQWLGRRLAHGAGCRHGSVTQHHHTIHLHFRPLGQLGHTDGRAGGIGTVEIGLHDLIDSAEMGQVGEIDLQLDHLSQAAAGGFTDSGQIVKNATHLHFDITLDQTAGGRVQGNLTRQVDGIATADRLGIRPNGFRRVFAVDHFTAHGFSLL
jgi:hypothetical protein